MTNQLRVSQRQQSAAANDDSAPISPAPKARKLSDRLLDMSEQKLRAYQSSATRIAGDPQHLRHAAASRAVPQIEAEIRRRAVLVGSLG